ncbi:MAG: glycosyltransferase family 39 protein [Candidatus Eremiobacteraeota bacterium]|nr:glycosyltransferase family 39 protein [Candidatus Eremiobacteraeota bacterium]MBC5827974.1 glycosyltransferase family 39 protein [Candidatus Eremiobacteraeota bacterium]
MTPAFLRALMLAAVVMLAAALRLYHLENPILDHPAWRQGDEASIARNFAQLQNNIAYPQTDYDGPPPNYVELELQIVPYLAAQAYRHFGVHETIGRLITVAFSLSTVVLLYALGAAIFSPRAGLLAAFLFAVAPSAVYYGRTFTPESTMICFSTGVLLFWWRWLERRHWSDFALAVFFGALAWLAKPPALVVAAPLIAMTFSRVGRRAIADISLYVFFALTLVPFFLYFSHVSQIAEWHWASGITNKHVLPALRAEFASASALGHGLQSALALLRMLTTTVLGPTLFTISLVGLFALPRDPRRPGRGWMFGVWLAALAAYSFVVANVERVDYYLILFVPFSVLVAGGAIDNVWRRLQPEAGVSKAAAAGLAAAAFVVGYTDMLEIHPYYTWSRPVYSAAKELDRKLAPDALIVMGHYDPAVLYTIGRKGWEEDALAWDVHDMTSAIAKGARYFIAVEVPRFRANAALYRFMRRYRMVSVSSGWQVYDTRHFARSLGNRK